MERCRFGGTVIDSAGYDAQCAILEIEFARDGQIWQYAGVPEEIWYCLKKGDMPDCFFHKFIKGQYTESRICAAKRQIPL
ncbi:MAG: KTSC domain-containing protein [Roseburia sp.]|nr:KTSC domain-containing protein [Roseburia sp.]